MHIQTYTYIHDIHISIHNKNKSKSKNKTEGKDHLQPHFFKKKSSFWLGVVVLAIILAFGRLRQENLRPVLNLEDYVSKQ